MIFRKKMANTSPAMLRFTAVMPAGKLVTEISWALIRCDLGSVSRIFYTSFMLPENRMYFLQVFHNIIYFFLRAEVWVASRILILPYLFSHFSTFWPLRLTKVKCEYLKTHFRQFPPKEVQLFRFLDGNFDQKSSLQNSTLYTSELVFSVCSHPFFPVFVRGVWCDSTISDINLSDSVQDLVAEKPPRRGSQFFSTWENLVDFLQNGSCLEVPWRSRQFLQSYHAQS